MREVDTCSEEGVGASRAGGRGAASTAEGGEVEASLAEGGGVTAEESEVEVEEEAAVSIVVMSEGVGVLESATEET